MCPPFQLFKRYNYQQASFGERAVSRVVEDLELAWGLTWVALVGLGCPRPGLEGYWSLRSTASAGSPCSGQLLQVQERLPAVGLQGGVFRLPPGPRHKGQEACVAWLA